MIQHRNINMKLHFELNHQHFTMEILFKQIYRGLRFVINIIDLRVKMNFRQTFSGSKYNPKIKLTKPGPKPMRRLQTQANQHGGSYKPTELQRSSYRVEQKRDSDKPKYLEVYSKVREKERQSHPRKTFKVHTNKPFILNKQIKTEFDEGASFCNHSQQFHQRKPSQSSNSGMQPNKYEIDGVAGKGTFGTVYVGHVRGTGRKVAIKKVLQDKRYKNRQLQILKTLHNSNLLGMKDHYMTSEGDKQYLNVVMDFYPENLYQNIKKKPVQASLVKVYLYQILRGLMYMSFSDIAHRDMKPHNVLVNPQTNKVVICDFGSAKQLVKGEPNLAYICSRCYRAPELIFGATDYTSQIDIWSVGCILVEMINGEPPFLGDSQIDQLIEIIKVMGSPSKIEVTEMNPEYDLKEYSKFPQVKKTEWKHILKTKDPLLLDLVNKIMQYSPKRRFSAEQALRHPYFDELRGEQTYKELFKKVKAIPELFDFAQDELENIKKPELLIPKWMETNHTSNLSTSNFKNLNSATSNLNISISKHKPSSMINGHGYTLSGLHNRKPHPRKAF